MINNTFPYKPRLPMMILVVLFFGACALVIANKALSNDRGVSLFKIIDLSPAQAGYFLWFLVAVSMVFVLAGIWGIYLRFTSKAVLVLSPTSITVPVGTVSQTNKTMDYADIVSIRERRIQREVFIDLISRDDKITINARMLPNKKNYQDVLEFLIAKKGGEGICY